MIRFQIIGLNNFQPVSSPVTNLTLSTTTTVASEFDPNAGEVIYINLPSGIQLSDGVGYGQRDINFVGQGILSAGALIGGANPTAAQVDPTRTEAARLIGQLIGVSAAAALGKVLSGNALGAAAGGAIAADNIGAAFDIASQTRFNPNTKTLLERVSIRSPTFSFNMIPTSTEEADQIRAIVKAFRVNMYPLVTTTGVGDVIGFMRYPNKFKIDIYSGLSEDIDNKYHISFLPSYLSACSTTYNSTSPSYFEDGSPVETNLTLTFIEERTLTRQDLLETSGI